MIEQIKQAYAFIKKWFWALPMWKRTILTSIIGAFAGSSIIGFLNKYALYYHALKQGFRMPVEGVEYLDLAVSLISFIIIIISIIGTIIIYTVVNGFHKIIFKRITDRRNRSRSKSFDSKISLMYVFKSFFPFYIFAIFFFGFTIYWIKEIMSSSFWPFYIFIFLFFSFTSLFFLITMAVSRTTAVNDNSKKLFTLTLVTLAILSISLSLFNQNLYSNFLATIHYGGRIPVVIEYRKADNTAASARGELLIRTSHSVTILNTDSCAHEEIPAERVSKIGFIKE